MSRNIRVEIWKVNIFCGSNIVQNSVFDDLRNAKDISK